MGVRVKDGVRVRVRVGVGVGVGVGVSNCFNNLLLLRTFPRTWTVRHCSTWMPTTGDNLWRKSWTF